mmetsp:Transcript_66638/g.77337  ORF Transcript_66638/g.77337 Transcript_66638/m.77337 type:complete len:123 (+) Transcript_66638:54-422(+)|eukprot:CAMPEP_0176432486 /NCGR_PEP_ID=MMETSP0127-20121128/15424_1 /TAXON_ID=938130 /ORGANISM="Platyophrya macrostoma, Strain WH" /LENGTH=122 /DNA_ID=CAMNT_0017814669 /DNA_START=38 /DNA_END=406 /DNA_ORIENTATION=+
METDKKSLFEQLGGEAAVDVCVDSFYEKVLADPKINHFFKDTDMKKQAQHQKAFLTVAFGGPNKYSGRSLRESHKKMGLTDEHFDAVIGHLAATLRELGVSEDLIKQVADVAETTRSDILNK